MDERVEDALKLVEGALQEIADANGTTFLESTEGYEYVKKRCDDSLVLLSYVRLYLEEGQSPS